MNKQLQALADQCWVHIPYGPEYFDKEKFAELIVKECGEIAYGTYWENPEGVRGIHLKDAILENFGVEA